MWAVQVLLFFTLSSVAWQDFKYRAVYWWLFPLLFLILVILKTVVWNWQVLLTDLCFNIAFLAIQFISLSIYFAFKQRRLVNIFNGYLGLGDVLLLIALAIYFSFANFIVFYLVSLICCVGASGLITLFSKDFKSSIPLAGMQAIGFVLYFGYAMLFPEVVLTSDSGMIKLLGL